MINMFAHGIALSLLRPRHGQRQAEADEGHEDLCNEDLSGISSVHLIILTITSRCRGEQEYQPPDLGDHFPPWPTNVSRGLISRLIACQAIGCSCMCVCYVIREGMERRGRRGSGRPHDSQNCVCVMCVCYVCTG